MSDSKPHKPVTGWRRGAWVEVRSLQEILATLDQNYKLEGMPFMPEMAAFCGRRLPIVHRADKVCVEGHPMRRLKNVVLLEGARCNGAAHDGCQRGCLMFWKTAWLKASTPPGPDHVEDAPDSAENAVSPLESAVLPTRRNGRYYCQSTELASATSYLSRWNPWCVLRDLFVGEATFSRLIEVVWSTLRRKAPRILGRGPAGRKTTSPSYNLGLNPGDWVEVKSRQEIEDTLTRDGKNRGLSFEMEMLDYCGQRCQVAFPLQKIISEQTGEMLHLSGTVILKGATCQGTCARNCPRGNHLYWREAWLTRVEPELQPAPEQQVAEA